MSKKEQLYTPRGILGNYPALDKVDYGSDDYPDPEGSFKCEVIFDSTDKEVKKFMKMLDALNPAIEEKRDEFVKAQLKKGKKAEPEIHPNYTYVYSEEGEKTDRIAVKFKTKYSGINKKGEKWTRKLPLYDGRGGRIKGKLGISGGSEVVIKFTLGDPYCTPKLAGVAKYLEGAQIIELVKWEDDGGGFEVVDDGYEFSEEDLSDTMETEPEAEPEDAEEDQDELPEFASK